MTAAPLNTISQLHVGELHESPDNPREITAEALDALVYSIQADPGMLDARPIIATLDGEVVCGNMRLRAARRLGMETVPVFIKEFRDEAQKREWMLRDNNSYGGWVPDELQALVLQHQSEGSDLKMLGFQDQELRDLLKADDELPQEDAPVDDIPIIYGVVIDCDGEGEQASLLEELTERGLKCRALMA